MSTFRLIVSFSRELFCLDSKQLFFNGNAYQKHTICENTTAKMQIIPRKWKALKKKNKYIIISLNFHYKWEELCPALIYWDPFVRIHQGSIIKCVDVYCFFNFSFLKWISLSKITFFSQSISWSGSLLSLMWVYKALLDFPVFMSDLK